MTTWPFDPDLPKNAWVTIEADGFDDAVPGCVYDGARLDGGIPLGGVGTGYFTLDGSGTIGHCSIYNDIVPPRSDFTEWLTLRVGRATMPLSTAEIAYWGHFPVADLVARFAEHPLDVGIRAFSPFVVGDAADSNIPAALFEIELRNRGGEALAVELLVTPPKAPEGQGERVALLGGGVRVEEEPVRVEEEPGALRSGEAFTVEEGGDQLRGLVTVALAPGGARRVRFVFAWHLPDWRDSGREAHVHRYGPRYPDARAVAEDALARFDSLLGRVLAWQGEIYRSDLPAWLRDWLVQSLYSMAKNSVWIARTRPDEWWGEDGWFTHSESHTGCPITETMVCRMHGHVPILFFFPELEASALEAFRHFQIGDGEIPFSYGMLSSMRDPRYHCQHPLNSGQYAQMVYRQFLRTGDRDQLARFYDSAKRAIRYQFSLDDDGDGLVNDQAHVKPGEHWPANQFYDVWPWWGTSAYVAGTWLATLAHGGAMARELGDAEFGDECDAWFDRGSEAYHDKLWTGDYYRLWNDPENGRRSDVSLGNQLMAQWCVKIAGLPDVLPGEKVAAALDTVERLNMAATPYGLVNGMTPEGERFDAGYRGYSEANDHAKQTFVGENLCAAMTYVYHGREGIGLEIARRIYDAIAIKSRSPWNQRCLIDAASGLPVWGDDYYSNMVVWAMPMALARVGIGAFVGGDGLVDRMIRAGAAAGGGRANDGAPALHAD